jgi:hypothetical protein
MFFTRYKHIDPSHGWHCVLIIFSLFCSFLFCLSHLSLIQFPLPSPNWIDPVMIIQMKIHTCKKKEKSYRCKVLLLSLSAWSSSFLICRIRIINLHEKNMSLAQFFLSSSSYHLPSDLIGLTSVVRTEIVRTSMKLIKTTFFYSIKSYSRKKNTLRWTILLIVKSYKYSNYRCFYKPAWRPERL